jgi:hypothetical protein
VVRNDTKRIPDAPDRMKIVFPYFGQLHQVLHSLPIAAAMAMRHRDVEVHVAAAKPAHLEFIRRMLFEHAPDAPLHIDVLRMPRLRGFPIKRRTMIKNRRYLRSFDAIVVPERTSLFMRHLVLGRTQLIWTRHGAGDRAIGFASDVGQFDFVLVAGAKIERRLLAAGLIRPGHYASGIYAKFDWLSKPRHKPRFFDNDRPTILYNPHFATGLSSWDSHGLAVLEFFAASEHYNLIFAPHVRLFEQRDVKKDRAFDRYACMPHLLIDLGSERSIDMSYVQAADLYLGDVSSQVSEFLIRPRPCLFINSHRVVWQGNPDYLFWTLGPVIEDLDRFAANLVHGVSRHADFAAAQLKYVEETFGSQKGESSGERAADAIVQFVGEIEPKTDQPNTLSLRSRQ